MFVAGVRGLTRRAVRVQSSDVGRHFPIYLCQPFRIIPIFFPEDVLGIDALELVTVGLFSPVSHLGSEVRDLLLVIAAKAHLVETVATISEDEKRWSVERATSIPSHSSHRVNSSAQASLAPGLMP